MHTCMHIYIHSDVARRLLASFSLSLSLSLSHTHTHIHTHTSSQSYRRCPQTHSVSLAYTHTQQKLHTNIHIHTHAHTRPQNHADVARRLTAFLSHPHTQQKHKIKTTYTHADVARRLQASPRTLVLRAVITAFVFPVPVLLHEAFIIEQMGLSCSCNVLVPLFFLFLG